MKFPIGFFTKGGKVKPLTPKLKIRYIKPMSPIPLRLDAVGKAGSAPNMSKTGAKSKSTKDREGHKIFPPKEPPPKETTERNPRGVKGPVVGTPQVYMREIVVSKKTLGKTPIQRKFMTGFSKVESSSSTLEKILKKLKKQ